MIQILVTYAQDGRVDFNDYIENMESITVDVLQREFTIIPKAGHGYERTWNMCFYNLIIT